VDNRETKLRARIADLEETNEKLRKMAISRGLERDKLQAEVKRLRSWLRQVLDAHTEYANNDTIRMIEAELGAEGG